MMKFLASRYRRAVILGSAALVMSLVCVALVRRTQPARSYNRGNPEEKARVAKADVANDVPFYERMEGIPAGVKLGMRMFLSDGRYRLAAPDDFRMPNWAIDRYGEELDRCIKFPVEGGRDINHDGVWYDYGAIVVDVLGTGPERYGLVIFNARRNEDQASTTHWLYRNRDLSRTFMHRLGEQLFVTDLFEDGSHKTCDVEWDKKLGQYTCEEATDVKGAASHTRSMME